MRADLVVIGSGPTGCAAALAARRRRPDAVVVLMDRSAFPRDKACGDGVAGAAVEELMALGAGDVVDGYRPITSLRLRGPLGAAVRARTPGPHWVVPRRVLDHRLVRAAEQSGAVVMRHRVRALQVRADGVDIDGEILAAGVVAADGAYSTVRRQLAITPAPPRHAAIAIRGYTDADPADREQVIDLAVDGGWPAYRWHFPVGDGTANIGYGVYLDAFAGGRDQLLTGLATAGGPARQLLAHRLPLSSAGPRLGRSRVLLAGDAAGLVNPLSGEGIFYGIVSGRLAAETLLDGGGAAVARYRRTLRRRLGRHLRTTRVAAALLRSRVLTDAGVAAAAAHFDEVTELALAGGSVTAGAVRDLLRELPAARGRGRRRNTSRSHLYGDELLP